MFCRYCGEETSSEYCSHECKIKYDKYKKYENKYAKKVFLSFLLYTIIVIAIGLLFSINVGGVIMIPFGLLMIIFPFANDSTQESFSLKKVILAMRVFGVAITLVGVVFLLL